LKNTQYGYDAQVAGADLLGYSREKLGSDKLGNERHLLSAPNGALKIRDYAFWEISGSYYNYEYFISGVKAYGDIDFFRRIISSKLDKISLMPAAVSWEINGSAEGYMAESLSLIGGVFALRGQDRFKYRSFLSVGGGAGLV